MLHTNHSLRDVAFGVSVSRTASCASANADTEYKSNNMHSAVIQHKQGISSLLLFVLLRKAINLNGWFGSRLRGYYSCYAIAPFAQHASLISPLRRIRRKSKEKGPREEDKRGLRRHCIHPSKGHPYPSHSNKTTPQKRLSVGPSAGDSLVS